MGGVRDAGDDASTRRRDDAGLAETAAGVTPAGGEMRSLAATTEPNSRLAATRSVGRAPGGYTKLEVGVVVGRYVVLGVLGAGAMGVVYAAFDPELDRKVALKLLQVEAHGAGSGSEARTRLLREAQALARLSHPGVVAIHDVGVHRDEVWIAMELVEGRTLRAWLAERPRGVAEVLAVMQAAGRGLAAAHAVGLVHRDIKPDNVMVDDAGRVRVMDFGLARRGAGEDAAALVTSGERAMLAVDVTTAGSLIGTPAYMAPEQFRGESVGPAADMFGFCVTLWEAVYGARPFAGRTLAELRDNVLAGRVVVTTGRGVPRWLTEVLRRGLAGEPARRFASMTALLTALERGQARMGRRRWWLAAGGVVALAGAIVGGLAVERRQAITACEVRGAAGSDAWTRRWPELERAFLATGKPHAATVWAKTLPWLEQWANAWGAADTAACLRREVEGRWDGELAARARGCLDEEQGRFASLVERLASADATTLNRATAAAAGLALPDRCLDEVVLRERASLPEDAQTTARTLNEQLAQASALHATGGFADGLVIAKAVVVAAEAAGLAATVAEGERLTGMLEAELADYPASERSLLRSLAAARAARSQRAALAGIVRLIWVVGERQTRFAEGEVWAEAARLEISFVGGDTRAAEAGLANSLGQLRLARGQHKEAVQEQEKALALWTELHGEAHPTVALALNNLGNAIAGAGDLPGAIARHEQALAIAEQTLGGEHPEVASTLSNLGGSYMRVGRYDDALAVHERALAIRERVFAADHPDVLESCNNLANVYKQLSREDDALRMYQRGLAGLGPETDANRVLQATLLYNMARLQAGRREFAAATAGHERAIALFGRALGERSVKRTYPMLGLAEVLAASGQLDAAARSIEQALAIRVEVQGRDHPDVAVALTQLATVERGRGRFDEALRRDGEALTIREAKLGKDNVQLAQMLIGIGETQLAAKRPALAIAPLERGLALTEPKPTYRPATAQLRLLLARALWDGGGDRARARGLAVLAGEDYAAGGDTKRGEEVRAWLAAHPG